MKQLILMRHSKAETATIDRRDFDRQLTEQGREDASEMGRRLSTLDLRPLKVLCSEAARAMETFAVVNKHLGHQGETQFLREMYEAGSDELASIIIQHGGDSENLMYVAHEPTLSDWTTLHSGQPVSFSTSTVVILGFQNLSKWADLMNEKPSAVQVLHRR